VAVCGANTPLLLIHAGAPDAQKEAAFRDAMFQVEMPREARIVWNEGEPSRAIVTAAEKESVDLLIAGALEGKEVASRSFLGAVARPVAKQARCSVLLLTHPQIGPNPFRRIVVITDFSDCAKAALNNALWLAEADSAEIVQVISIHTAFMQARAESSTHHEKAGRTREEEEQLLRDFMVKAPACSVPVESRIVDATTGFAAYDFTQSIGANLLIVPASERTSKARAIDDGLGATGDSMQSLDRARKVMYTTLPLPRLYRIAATWLMKESYPSLRILPRLLPEAQLHRLVIAKLLPPERWINAGRNLPAPPDPIILTAR
jgi:nucleotide-binding universal stress UspA family protein